MNPQQTQQSNPQPTESQTAPDPSKAATQSAASLSFATHLMGQMMQHQNPSQASQEPQSEPEQSQEPKEDTEKADLAKEFTSFKDEVEGMIKSQIGDLKREIQTALTEDESEKPNEPSV